MDKIGEEMQLPESYVYTIDGKQSYVIKLRYYDETRLFYVAVSRAKSNVLFTSSPKEDKISSSFIHRLGIDRPGVPVRNPLVSN